jgi:hypothetical protein
MTQAWNPILQLMEEEQQSRHGEGVSRPVAKAHTRLYPLRVRQPQQRPMMMTMRAESKAAAIRYAQARWPNAAVEAA